MSLDFDGVYGATSGSWTTDMFVEAVYREIKANTAPWKARLLRNVPSSELAFMAPARPASAAAKNAAAKPAKKAAAIRWKASGCSTSSRRTTSRQA